MLIVSGDTSTLTTSLTTIKATSTTSTTTTTNTITSKNTGEYTIVRLPLFPSVICSVMKPSIYLVYITKGLLIY